MVTDRAMVIQAQFSTRRSPQSQKHSELDSVEVRGGVEATPLA